MIDVSFILGETVAPKVSEREEKRGIKIMLTDDQIKYMVDRFLGWQLPEDFTPDGGISFKKEWGQPGHVRKNAPSGTNLFDATQADAMVRYMLEGMME